MLKGQQEEKGCSDVVFLDQCGIFFGVFSPSIFGYFIMIIPYI